MSNVSGDIFMFSRWREPVEFWLFDLTIFSMTMITSSIASFFDRFQVISLCMGFTG
jgi:hypothetical protein